MENTTSFRIFQLCELWKLDNLQFHPDGSYTIRLSDKFRLRNNGIVFHDLTFLELQITCTSLMGILLLPKMSSVIDGDHLLLWSWIGELILYAPPPNSLQVEREIKELFEACLRSALAGTQSPDWTPQYTDEERNKWELIDFHTQQLAGKSHLVLSFLSFPLLEAMLKKICQNFITMNNEVLTNFTVIDKNGDPKQYRVGRKCNSLRDLLHLVYNQVASPNLREQLDNIKNHLSAISGGVDGFDLIYSWRNSSLHGETNFTTIGGTIFSLACQIGLSLIEQNFVNLQKEVLEHTLRTHKRTHETYSRPRWSCYPP